MLDKDFKNIISNIKEEIINTQIKTMQEVNSNLIMLYFKLGKIVSENKQYGNNFTKQVSTELKLIFPNMKGFSERNIRSMRLFYEEYAENTIKNGQSRNVLAIQIETEFHKKIGNSNNNFNVMLPPKDSNLVNNTIKYPYIFDFITLKEEYKEKELEEALIIKIKNVLLELGKEFSFVGNQYKISTDNQDFYIDLLFYHLELRCYIAVELKTSEFKPEYIGQLGFYVTAVNETIKKECDAPTIGLLLCREKNRVTVDWALKSANVPMGVSTYKLKEYLPKELIDKLPTEEEINLYLNVEDE